MIDPREAEWLEHQARSLAKGVCPDSGLRLHANGNAAAVLDEVAS